jgi:hypothetical protein
MSDPKITFADTPGIITQHSPVSGPTETVLIHGIPIAISPGVGDIIAATHLGFEKALAFFREMTNPPMPTSRVVMPEGQDEEIPDGDYLDLTYLNSLSPMARAERLAMFGLQQSTPSQAPGEPDEAKAEVERLIREQNQSLGGNPAQPEGGE